MDETHGISVEDKQGEFFHDMTPLLCWDLAYHNAAGLVIYRMKSWRPNALKLLRIGSK
jgi:hypothetical protein